MNTLKKLPLLLSKPIILTVLVGSAIIGLLPNYFNKFETERVYTFDYDLEFENQYFYDLDGDGVKERIQSGNDQISGKARYTIYQNTFSLVDQYNWKGKYFFMSSLVFGDYDNNGLSEVYSFTVHNDSLFINGMEFKSELRVVDNLFVCKANKYQGDLDIAISSQLRENQFLDLNNDGLKELLFNYQALYSGIPRVLYALNIKNNTFIKSEPTGAYLRINALIDLDNDGQKEIICGSSSPANNKPDSSLFLHDYSSWIVVYDKCLNTKRALMEISGVSSGIYMFTHYDGDTTWLLSRTRQIKSELNEFTLNIHDAELRIVKSDTIRTSNKNQFLVVSANNKLYAMKTGASNQIHEINMELRTTPIYTHPENIRSVQVVDLDNDGKEEFIFTTLNSDIAYILTHDFKHKTEVSGKIGRITSLQNGKNDFAIITNKNLRILRYNLNPYYYAKFSFYISIYSVLFGLLYFIKKYRALKLTAANQQHLELQLRALKNQINPHFTFNVINSISMVIAKGDLVTAQMYFEKFSSLLRDILEYSDQVVISLGDELDIIKKYLELEKIRFKEKINYKIEIEDEVDLSLPIPRMLLQHHIENAIKHGLMHKKEAGNVKLQVIINNTVLEISVEDDGIGRNAAMALNIDSTAKGTNINAQLLKIYHQIYDVMITFRIEDLVDKNNEPLGTKVVFTIPLTS